jgi:hypothetical protein
MMLSRVSRHRWTGHVIGGVSIGSPATGSGQISDKYQYYGHADFSDDAVPGSSWQAPTQENRLLA